MRDFLLALSLANLLFLRVWNKILVSSYFDDLKPDGIVVTILVLVTCAGLWIGWRLIRSSNRLAAAGRILFLLLLLIPLNALRLYYQQDLTSLYGHRYDRIAWFALAVLLAPIVFAAVTRRARLGFLVRYGSFLVLALAPFAIFTLGGVARESYRRAMINRSQEISPTGESVSLAPSATTDRTQPLQKRPHVVWIIFDELEERTAFTDRPATVSMPELDRFRKESFVAGAAYPPGNETMLSVPALLDGRAVTSVEPRGETLFIWHEGDTAPVVWNARMTVFAEAAAAGNKIGLVGVFFPYCATHGRVITECRDLRTAPAREGFINQAKQVLTIALDAVPFAFRLFLRKPIFANEIERYQTTIQQATALAADPALDFVYVHIPLPHPPGIYDRATGRMATSRQYSYLDNLALTDISFGIIRRAMEQAGTWQSSTVIVTADHSWRTDEVWKISIGWTEEDQRTVAGRQPDHRVPFMVKLAGPERPMFYERPFNTLITRKIVMEMLQGRLSTSRELVQLLDNSGK